jgi:hypothetical protein
MSQVIARIEARKQGLPYYYTGQPCKNGNLYNRRTSNGDCMCPDCLRDRAAGKKEIRASKKNAG